MRGPGKGKTNNPNGRKKGSQNRTTKEARELLQTILYGQIDNIAAAFEKILADDPAKYIDACAKMFTYVLPKKTDISSGDEPIKQSINVIVDKADTAVTLKDLRGA